MLYYLTNVTGASGGISLSVDASCMPRCGQNVSGGGGGFSFVVLVVQYPPLLSVEIRWVQRRA